MNPLLDLGPEGTPSRGAYDNEVFLSFSGGIDTEQPFVDHLYAALVRSGFRVFAYADEKAVEHPRISIIVLSKAYASSKRCLEELATILKCRRDLGNLVVPVYYDADPSEIRERTGSIAADFARYEQQFKGEEIRYEIGDEWMDKVERWREALREASDLMGFVFPNKTDIDESITIQRFVDFIEDGLKRNEISSWCGRECHLINSGLSKLPENMNFPILRKLFLQDSYDLSEIPLSFFESMPALQELDMSRTSIKYLPPSISNLVELQKLLLRGCKLLMELPPEIRALKNLEVFDLAGTELIYIPMEIEMLHKLERLKVSLCVCADEYISEIKENGEIIPRKTLSKLSHLKELSIFVDPDCEWWDAEVEAITQDLFSLEKLETLELYFPTVELLQKFLQLPSVECQSLSNFRLIVGRHDQGIISRVPGDLQDTFERLEKCLKYVNGEGNIDGVGQALKHARALFLDRHWTIDRLSVFKADEMDNLRFCLLVECNEMKTIVDGGDLYIGDNKYKTNDGRPILGLLQCLNIHYMKNLESIWIGPVVYGCLYHLHILALHTCPELSTIFTLALLRNLMNLKELIVEDCPKVESLVSVESSSLESGQEFLPSLEKISLLHLPGLVSISSGLLVAPRLERMVVYNCPKLRRLSPVEMSSEDIKEIKGESEWWEALEWKILEWKSNQPDYLRHVFVPLRRDGLMNQLAEARNSHNTLSMIQNSSEIQLQAAREAKNMWVPVKNLEEKMDSGSRKAKNMRLCEGLPDIPKIPDLTVGLNAPLEELKGLLLKDGVSVVVLSAPGGLGKTTLATLLCHDYQIQAIFGDIFFVTVSKEANLDIIVQKLFRHKDRQPPELHSDEDAIYHLEHLLREIGTHPVLIVLDDVWSGWHSHIQNLMFQIPGYKILVTSRFVFPEFDSTYELNTLNDQDAMTLFCRSAFPEDGSSNVPDDLVNKIVKGCKGFPLALTAAGQSLRGQPELRWRNVVKKLSEEGSFFDSHDDLRLSLQTNLDAFNEMSLTETSIIKECYLDIGSFPKDESIPATALRDIWNGLYKLDEERKDITLDLLHELSSSNLVTIVPRRSDESEVGMEHYVKQSDLLRERIHQSSQEPVEQRKRLIMEITGNELPKWCIEQRLQPLRARLLSITTDETFSSIWYGMQLPEVEVVILNFRAHSYTLPQFMERMDQLKVLIITNYGFYLAELNNFMLLGRLSNLRRIRLENISISSLGGSFVQMMNLQKISLSMCNMEKAFQNCKNEQSNLFPNLVDISIESCVNLVEFPAGLCNLVHLKKLSISDCHELCALPPGLGRLTNLEFLTLRSCMRLEALPESIGDLYKLRVLDISDCVSMINLPLRMGELHSLRKLDIRRCMKLSRLRRSVVNLVELEELVCSEENFRVLESCKTLPPNLKINVVKEDIDLNWLQDLIDAYDGISEARINKVDRMSKIYKLSRLIMSKLVC